MTRMLPLALLSASLCAGQEVLLTVNGQEVTSDKLIDNTLFHEIARRNGIEPTATELAAMRKKWNAVASKVPHREEAGERPATRNQMDERWLEELVITFKVDRFLWNKHGGRLALSAFGFHLATDALAAEVLELERLGVVRFEKTSVREDFFRRMRTYSGDGITSGERARQILSKPPWE